MRILTVVLPGPPKFSRIFFSPSRFFPFLRILQYSSVSFCVLSCPSMAFQFLSGASPSFYVFPGFFGVLWGIPNFQVQVWYISTPQTSIHLQFVAPESRDIKLLSFSFSFELLVHVCCVKEIIPDTMNWIYMERNPASSVGLPKEAK